MLLVFRNEHSTKAACLFILYINEHPIKFKHFSQSFIGVAPHFNWMVSLRVFAGHGMHCLIVAFCHTHTDLILWMSNKRKNRIYHHLVSEWKETCQRRSTPKMKLKWKVQMNEKTTTYRLECITNRLFFTYFNECDIIMWLITRKINELNNFRISFVFFSFVWFAQRVYFVQW